MNNSIKLKVQEIMEYNTNKYRTEENINKVLTILAEYNEYNSFFNVIQNYVELITL